MDKHIFSIIGLERHFLVAIILIVIVITLLPSVEGLDECPPGFQLATTSNVELITLRKDISSIGVIDNISTTTVDFITLSNDNSTADDISTTTVDFITLSNDNSTADDISTTTVDPITLRNNISTPDHISITTIEQYCYKKKDPEKFSDKFVDCNGSLFSYGMYQNLSLPRTKGRIWTEYKSWYPGGVFIDWSYTNSTGQLLKWLPKFSRGHMNISKKICVGFDPVHKFTVMRCDGRHYRYCVVKPGSNTSTVENVSLSVTINSTTIKLFVNYKTPRDKENRRLNMDNIMCFTDSVQYYPVRTSLKLLNANSTAFDEYAISPMEFGYYWCTHSDSKFHSSMSNQTLYIDESEAMDVYAVTIKAAESYTLKYSEISRLLETIWIRRLREYITYSVVYGMHGNKTEPYNNMTIMKFRNESGYHVLSEFRYIFKGWQYKLKRLYMDGRTALLHVQPYTNNTRVESLTPVKPGQWDSIFIEDFQPVYYCDNDKNFSLGMNYSSFDSKQYKCEGDYNNGVKKVPIPLDTIRSTTAQPQVKDLLSRVIMELEKLLNNTDPIMVEDIEDIFTQVDEILAMAEEFNIPGRFLHLLDEIGMRIDLDGFDDAFVVRPNIGLVIGDARPQAPVNGLWVAIRETDAFTYDSISIIREFNKTLLSTDLSEMLVSLPASVSTSKRRVTFVVFRDDRAFQGRSHYTVNSRLVSVNVENITKFPPGEVIDIHHVPLIYQKRNQSRVCGYWRYNDNGTGTWSQEGCTFITSSQGLLDNCRCDHLTHFAEILVPRTVFSEVNETVLETISIIGCCVSILGLLIIGLSAVLFSSWRRDFNNKIWLQLCISILILSISFLVIVFAQFQKNNILCILIGVTVHYSVLSSFCWMLVAAVLSYRRLVLVFSVDASHKLLRASAFAWGTPVGILAILFSVAPNSYAVQYEDKFSSGAFCYPSGLALWLAVYAPITLVLLSNWILFVLIVYSVFIKPRPQNQGNDVNEAFRCVSVSCLLVFLFGLPWLFGIFSFNVVCAYLFTFLVTLQGFVLFFFFVLGNKNMRDLWLNKLKTKRGWTS